MGMTGAGAPVVELDDAGGQNEEDEAKQKPVGSRIVDEPVANGFRLRVPPRGIWKTTGFFFVFGVVWCGFTTVFTVLSVTKGLTGDAFEAVVFLGVFWLIGFSVVLISVNVGRRSAIITVAGGRLLIASQGIFGAKQREFSREAITAIRMGDSCFKSNRQRLMELQIHPVDGKKIGYLVGWDEDELRWIAGRLRQALKVPKDAPEGAEVEPSGR
jgi:hypothetical protein